MRLCNRVPPCASSNERKGVREESGKEKSSILIKARKCPFLRACCYDVGPVFGANVLKAETIALLGSKRSSNGGLFIAQKNSNRFVKIE